MPSITINFDDERGLPSEEVHVISNGDLPQELWATADVNGVNSWCLARDVRSTDKPARGKAMGWQNQSNPAWRFRREDIETQTRVFSLAVLRRTVFLEAESFIERDCVWIGSDRKESTSGKGGQVVEQQSMQRGRV